MSDVIYEETYEDILPCYYVGMLLNISLSALVGIPFCIREYLVGKVDIIYVLQVIADTLPWFLCSILCCTCLSVRITKNIILLCRWYDSDSVFIFSACKSISLGYYIWNAVFADNWILADRLSGNVGSPELF